MAVPARRSANLDAHAAPGVRAFLIADIRGYTRFTQAHGDIAAARLAERFAQVAREAVSARGGEVVELRGDEALAVFSSARQAIRAAAELQLALGEETAADPTLPLGAGIGLDAGEAIAVEGGFRGGALNLAARLCAKAGPGETLASDGVVHLARSVDGIRFEELEAETFKGIDEPVRFVRVIGPAAPAVSPPAVAPSELPPGLDAAVVPLVGRERELWWLRGSWRLARRGQGRLLAISGPAGIGRTRLAVELARMVHDEGAVVRYLPLESDATAVERLAVELTATTPTLIVIDDLDLAEGGPLTRLARLTDGIAAPVLVLATCRDEATMPALEELFARLDAADAHRALGPVDADAVLAIVGVYSSRPRAEVPVASILEASEGVPASVHALAAEWARTEASRRLGSTASRASTGRRELRAMEAELADNVIDLQLIRERSRLVAAGALADGATCPFKGLAPFEAADADLFFGRERLVAELVARLVGATFLGVVGPSGSGKSSAVRAGLLPALAGGVLPASEGWRQVLLRPGAEPMHAFRRAVDASDDEDPVEVALAGLAPDARVVVVVDQFEELFTNCEDEAARGAFVDALVRLADDPDRRAKVVTALRADFYGRYAAYPQLAELLATGHVLVGPMQADEFQRAIELPAQRAGLRAEPGLVDALVADVLDEPGALPLLSTALLELWTRRQGRTLTLRAYEQSGGVRGAVARMAEEAYGGLPLHEQPVARAVLLRLASEEDGRTIAPRRAPLSEFDTTDAAVSDVITSLTARRLLTVDEGSLEVAHDALLREWPRLAGWLDEDAQGRGLRRHLTAAAHEWEVADRDPAELYRGARLATALDWTAEHDVELNALEREFLAESRAATEREAERARRTNRRLRLLLGAAVAALAVAMVAGGYAVVQQRQAEEAAAAEKTQRQEADAQRQAAEAQKAEAEHAALIADAHRIGAQALTEDAIDRSLLYAREAVALDDSPATRSALLAALERAPAAITILRGGGDPINWVDMPPDGSVLVAGTNLGQIMFWDAATGRILTSGAEFGASLFSHDISPDGTRMAVVDGNEPPSLGLVDLEARLVIQPTRRVVGALGPVLYTSGGSAIVMVEDEGGDPDRRHLVFHDPSTLGATGRTIAVPGGAGDAALAAVGDDRIAYSFLAEDDADSVTQIIDVASGAVVRSLPFSGPVAATADGRLLGVGRTDGTVTFVDLVTGRLTTGAGEHEAQVTGLAFTPDERTLVSVGLDRNVLSWDVSNMSVREALRGHSGPAFGPAISPDGATAYTGSFDGTIIAWDLAGDRRLVKPFTVGTAKARGSTHFAVVAGDDRTLVFALPGGRVRLHDLAGLAPDRDIPIWDPTTVAAVDVSIPDWADTPSGEIYDLAAQPRGTKVAITSDLPVPVLLDTATGAIQRLVGGHSGWFTAGVAFSADGTQLATSGYDEQVVVWDTGSGRLLHSIASKRGWANALAFDPSGTSLAVGGAGGSGYGEVDVWDLRTLTPYAAVRPDVWNTWSADFTPDGTRLVTAAEQSGDVAVFDIATQRPLFTIDAHAGMALDATVDPSGQFIASAGEDGVAKLWDLATGRAIGTPLEVRQGVAGMRYVAIALIDGGRKLVEVDADGYGAIWPLDESLWETHACDVAGRTLTTPEVRAIRPGFDTPVGCTD